MPKHSVATVAQPARPTNGNLLTLLVILALRLRPCRWRGCCSPFPLLGLLGVLRGLSRSIRLLCVRSFGRSLRDLSQCIRLACGGNCGCILQLGRVCSNRLTCVGNLGWRLTVDPKDLRQQPYRAPDLLAMLQQVLVVVYVVLEEDGHPDPQTGFSMDTDSHTT